MRGFRFPGLERGSVNKKKILPYATVPYKSRMPGATMRARQCFAVYVGVDVYVVRGHPRLCFTLPAGPASVRCYSPSRHTSLGPPTRAGCERGVGFSSVCPDLTPVGPRKYIYIPRGNTYIGNSYANILSRLPFRELQYLVYSVSRGPSQKILSNRAHTG